MKGVFFVIVGYLCVCYIFYFFVEIRDYFWEIIKDFIFFFSFMV